MDGALPESMAILKDGAKVIKGYVKKLPETPGVYRMIDAAGEVLYVGKAKALKRRVTSYTQVNRLPIRLQRMVAATVSMEFVHTHTEAEALLLESNLIKKLKPRYNILLRDDKSFPYILLTGDHDYPQVVKHRGAKKRIGEYYGPFASVSDVNRTITILQRIFMLRNCTDSYFSARTRPCLQYHIKRCSAPCVGLVSSAEYREQLDQAKAFLDGKSAALQQQFSEEMQKCAAEMDYEQAAMYRDRIKALSAIQSRQDINFEGVRDADVLALVQREGRSCVQVFFFRGGRNYGNRAYFPRHDKEEEPGTILSSFMAQFYENKGAPKDIYVSEAPDEQQLLEEAFSGDFKVKIIVPKRGEKKRALDFVKKNAEAALGTYIAEKANEDQLLKEVAELFDMDESPSRIEVYDNSHISGTNMVGAMIVAGAEGFNKSAYRKFNIKQAGASDDYGMMREVMSRRFRKALESDGGDITQKDWPDLLLIDGGLGQLNVCKEVLEDYGILDKLTIVAISKGEDRNAGREEFHMIGRDAYRLPERSSVLHYLQRLRDEAHRFAIGAHRARRSKDIKGSPLDEVDGIGAKRKKALLSYFGSAKAVAGAGVEDLLRVEGISRAVAQKIYDHFHG
ncbi:MAG: excinuclease ABC subunit C [Micavibrio sp. TMED27]|nr:excinuclease ABC subunit C [Micavibrio sp.]OUT92178.1 MAG: excinuclease ABC subunit C [Micavibrio sp. TMED27]